MDHQHHSTLREGLLTGLIGAVVVAVWYLAYDLGRGQPGYTPNLLGQVFVARDTMPAVRTIMPQAIADYSVLHVGVFLLLGILLAWLTHMAIRNPALRMGMWLGLVITFLLFLGLLFMLYSATDQRFPWWSALGGSILGIGSMGLYLWRRHPGLRGTFRAAPLGDEVKPPPHPPDGSPR
jgi:NhaP-type Na+/H+ and K+/H+ antiporter